MTRENLDQYLDAYRNDPFEHENDMMLNAYVARCIEYSENRDSYLELGIGHGIVLRELSAHYKRVLVLEGAPTLVKEYADNMLANDATSRLAVLGASPFGMESPGPGIRIMPSDLTGGSPE